MFLPITAKQLQRHQNNELTQKRHKSAPKSKKEARLQSFWVHPDTW